MEDILLEIENGIAELVSLFNQVKEGIGDRPVSKDIREGVGSFTNYYKDYTDILLEGDIEKVAHTATMISVYGQSFARAVIKIDIDENTRVYSEKLLKKGLALRSFIENSPILTAPLTGEDRSEIINSMQNYQFLKKQMKGMQNDFEDHQDKVEKLLIESKNKAVSLDKDFDLLESIYNEKISKISKRYEKALQDINDKNDQLDILLGNAASRVIVSEYADSARQERISAEWLRAGSLVCMTIIIGIAGYSFYESIHQSFDLSNALLRLALVFLLSVPAAYLARESTKHRQQQYTHLQTSLDLKAINPYIASLPEEEQHKIKSEIAQRIFAPKDFQSISNESYPINSQEVIMALISKFGNDKDKSAD